MTGDQRTPVLGFFYIVLLVFLLSGWGIIAAYGHSWYDPECCSDRDCRWLHASENPKPLPGGAWLLSTGEIVPREKVKFSRDEMFHLCRFPNGGTIFCLYIPSWGS